MKNTTSTQTKILLKAIDLELKAILKKDVENFRTRQQQTKNGLEFIRQIIAA
jgi:hypothetical protein